MRAHLIGVLAMNEVRLRMRRTSTMVALLGVVVLGWLMLADPSSGSALMAVNDARVLYTSSTIAIGSASLGGFVFALGGFYLVRGRMGEDIRSGTGSVIGATPVGNALFLAGRWLGGVAYLGALIGAFMLTMVALHALRGDGPIEPLVYLQNYLLLLLPAVVFVVSCAILFDSWAPLMGKAGDVVYFFVWMGQMSLMAVADQTAPGVLSPVLVFDFSGIVMAMVTLREHLGASHGFNISLGVSTYNGALPPLTLAPYLWSAELVLMRAASAVLALLPMLPAVWLFHRFSPDRVKVSRARERRSPLEVLNGWLRPLSRTVHPLFRLGAVVPGFWGRVAGDVALTFVASPSAIAALAVALVASVVVDSQQLGPVLMACVVFWGILVSDTSTRDFQADTESMTGAVGGGGTERYLRQLAATVAVGLMFMGTIALRWSVDQPVRAAALLAGVLSLAALASLFGRTSRTARTFMALFLFGFYVAVNASTVPMLDAVGFNGVANVGTVLLQLAIAAAAAAAGYAYNRNGAR